MSGRINIGKKDHSDKAGYRIRDRQAHRSASEIHKQEAHAEVYDHGNDTGKQRKTRLTDRIESLIQNEDDRLDHDRRAVTRQEQSRHFGILIRKVCRPLQKRLYDIQWHDQEDTRTRDRQEQSVLDTGGKKLTGFLIVLYKESSYDLYVS